MAYKNGSLGTRQKGMFLYEALIVVVLSSCIIFCLCSHIVSAVVHFSMISKRLHARLALSAAQTCFFYDIHNALHNKSSWLACTPHDCFFITTDYAYAWYYDDRKKALMRCIGHYDVHTERWTDKKKTCMVRDIARCFFDYKKENDADIAAVTMTINKMNNRGCIHAYRVTSMPRCCALRTVQRINNDALL